MTSPLDLVPRRPRRAAAAAAEKITAQMYGSPYQEQDSGEGEHPFCPLGTGYLLTIHQKTPSAALWVYSRPT